MDVIVFYAGLLAILAGASCLVRPFAWLGIRTRPAAAVVLLAGVAIALLAAYAMGGREVRADDSMRISAFMPVYHFREVHSVRVRASVPETYRAVKAVTPGEIRLLGTLLGLRQLPARLLGGERHPSPLPSYALESHSQQEGTHGFPEGRPASTVVAGTRSSLVYALRKDAPASSPGEILRAYVNALRKRGGVLVSEDEGRVRFRLGPERLAAWIEVSVPGAGDRYAVTILRPSESSRPILDLLTSGEFLLLSEESDREVVIGTVNRAWKVAGGAGPRIDAGGFAGFGDAGYAKITWNITVEPGEPGWSSVRTETRVFATDPATWRRFAVYWRVIYPGSAAIRREWLKAIKRRAEARLPMAAAS